MVYSYRLYPAKKHKNIHPYDKSNGCIARFFTIKETVYHITRFFVSYSATFVVTLNLGHVFFYIQYIHSVHAFIIYVYAFLHYY